MSSVDVVLGVCDLPLSRGVSVDPSIMETGRRLSTNLASASLCARFNFGA